MERVERAHRQSALPVRSGVAPLPAALEEGPLLSSVLPAPTGLQGGLEQGPLGLVGRGTLPDVTEGPRGPVVLSLGAR